MVRWLALLPLIVASCKMGDEPVADPNVPLWYREPVVASTIRTKALKDLDRLPVATIADAPQFVIRDEGEGRGAIGRIVDIVVRSGSGVDTLFALDRQLKQVAVYNGEGKLLATYGRAGDGPGEFRDPTTLVHMPWSQRLGIWDEQLRRFTTLNLDGSVSRTVNVYETAGLELGSITTAGGRVRPVKEGFILELRMAIRDVPPTEQFAALVFTDSNFTGRDTLFTYRVPPITISRHQDGKATYWHGPKRLAPIPRWDVRSDAAILFSAGAPFTFFVQAFGQPVIRINDAATRVAPMTLEDRIRSVQRRVFEGDIRPPSEMSASETTPEALEVVTRESFADWRPSITGFLSSDDGRIWIRTFDPGNDVSGMGRRLIGFDSEGIALGILELPPHFVPLRLHAGTLYGGTIDSLGLQQLRAYRMPPAFAVSR